MNWTEGALARHSRRKGWDEEAARQKQYFAKQRARLQTLSQPKPSQGVVSFVPSYIPQSPRVNSEALSTATACRRDAPPRKRLMQLTSESGPDKTTSSEPRPFSSEQLGETIVDLPSVSHSKDLETKRRKLLDKNDWTGIEFQKPLYTGSPAYAQSRARPTPTSSQKRSHRNDQVSNTCIRDGRSHAHDGQEPMVSQLANRINIQVGSQDFRWSQASNSFKSRACNDSPVPSFQGWVSHRETRSSPYAPSGTAAGALLSAGKSDRPVYEKYQRPETRQRQISRDNEGSEPFSRNANELPCRQTVLKQAQRVVLSSLQHLHHPQPAHTRNLLLLGMRSSSLEPADSLVAQTGAMVPSAHDRAHKNTEWMNWLTSPGEKKGQYHHQSQAADMEGYGSITPGVSQHWAQWEPVSSSYAESPQGYRSATLDDGTQRLSSVAVSPELEWPHLFQPSSPAQASLKQNADRCRPKPGRQSQSIFDQKADLQMSTPNDLLLPVRPELAPPPIGPDLIDLLHGEEDKQDHIAHVAVSDPLSEDEEEVWKEFVFDVNIGEINRKAREEAQEQIKRQLQQPPLKVLPRGAAEPPALCLSDLWTSIPTEKHYRPREDGTVCKPHSCLEAASTDARSSAIAHPRSQLPKPQQAEIRFYQPHVFVGRFASLQGSTTIVSHSLKRPVLTGRARVSGRSGKGREPERPDIRAVPNYDEDPIEESL